MHYVCVSFKTEHLITIDKIIIKYKRLWWEIPAVKTTEIPCICSMVFSRSNRELEFPIVIIVYLIDILSVTMEYSVLKLVPHVMHWWYSVYMDQVKI